MVASSSSPTPVIPIFLEGCFTAIAFAASFAWPSLGAGWFSCIERAFSRLARKKGLSVVIIGFSALLLRLAILPFCPIPLPFVPDDFSFLLSADTFAHFRLANPTPAMWTHFESIHITMVPTYASMYFPAQGLVLAAGKLLFGHPWYGLLITSALMCASICWMLQAWLPPSWALLGGLLAILHLALFSYWINTYHAAGAIGALGGSLILGALPRLMKTARFRNGLLMAVGIVLVALTRPYEGLLLCLPVALVLGRWAFRGKNRPPAAVLLRRAALPLAFIAAAIAWLGYYDYRAFSNPATLPYTVDRAEYAVAPYYVWQSQRPDPGYRHASLRHFYYDNELSAYKKIHSWSGFLPQVVVKVGFALVFFAGFALFPPLIMVRRALMDRRIRFLVVCLLVMMAGMLIQIFLIPHYLAPFVGVFYAIGLQSMRHLRLWSPGDKPVGATLVRLSVTICLVMAGLRLYAGPLHLALPMWPAANWNYTWYGPDHFGTERARIESSLEQLPGKQLVIVRYSSLHNPLEEWVYNSADIDGSKVIWAREMDSSNNDELIRYYHDRQIWLAQPDTRPAATLSPYPMPAQLATSIESVAAKSVSKGVEP